MSVGTSTGPARAPAARTPEDHVVILFGATGDLARRKLLPGLFRLAATGLMPKRFRIIGTSRANLPDEEFRQRAGTAIEEFGREATRGGSWEAFRDSLSLVGVGDGLGALSEAVRRARCELGGDPRLLHYLSLPPMAAAPVVRELADAGLGEGARIALEKPFGFDLASARKLNATVLAAFDEARVFRIDHYLGREAVLNLLALRFANGMFEPVWNREHIDHVQIDVPETLSIEMRGDFYEQTGAFRDMVVTHLFQVLGFVAMEPPASLDATALMSERARVFEAMLPLEPGDVVRGQYAGYRDTDRVAAGSEVETFVALRAFVDNERWAGIPFYLRTGKRLAEGHHQLMLAFKQPTRRMFPLDCRYQAESFGFDHLTFELGDPGGISTRFLAKVPGPSLQLGEAEMSFSYATAFDGPVGALEPYERLLHDVMAGDRTLFTTSKAIERIWEISQPLLESPPHVRRYEPGSWGPEESRELIAPHRWHLPGHRA